MPQLLTKRRQKWISKYRPDVVKGAAISPNYGIAARYAAALEPLIKCMVDETRHQLEKLYNTPHAQEYFAQDAIVEAAGIFYVDGDDFLLLKRRDGSWAFAGGKIEKNETPEAAAIRESQEEIGHSPQGELKIINYFNNESVQFITYLSEEDKFTPVLNEEHSAYMWANLNNLPSPLHPGARSTLKLYFDKSYAMDDTIASQARILTNLLIEKFQKLFDNKADQMAFEFADHSASASAKSVQASLAQLSGGLSIPSAALTGDLQEIFKATVAENVALIKSIPAKYLNGVQQAVMRSITGQEGKDSLVAYLQRQGSVTYARAKVIALDQTRKANNNFSKARLIKAGVEQGEWIHVPSNHPRKTHEAMAGKIFDLKEGLYDSQVQKNVMPGELPNCRCKFRAVLTFTKQDDNGA